jgi:hypothetical protein
MIATLFFKTTDGSPVADASSAFVLDFTATASAALDTCGA